jgi:hypothetical protein
MEAANGSPKFIIIRIDFILNNSAQWKAKIVVRIRHLLASQRIVAAAVYFVFGSTTKTDRLKETHHF